jgi:predicted Rossmann fold nucleotide-binding protein DprA/Smf involved in DNA uptake
MNEMKYLGNKEILNNYKIGFLCSRKVPSNIILKTYDWAIEQREKGNCIISGFHSIIEKDVFHYLIKGNQPIILVLARGLYKAIPKIFEAEIDKQRLLIISPFTKKILRASEETASKRNTLIIELSDELFIPFKSPDGRLSSLVHSLNNSKKLSTLS